MDLRSAFKTKALAYRNAATAAASLDISKALYELGRLSYAHAWALNACTLSAREHDEARIILGHIYLNQSSPLKAWRQFKQALQGSSGVQALIGMAKVCSQSQRPIFHNWLVRKLEKDHPCDSEALAYVSHYYLSQDEFRHAWQAIQKCLDLSGENPECWELAYQCSQKLKQYELAVKIAKKLISINPGSAAYHAWLGEAHHLNCDPKEACEAYFEASKLSQSNLVYYLNANNRVRRIAQSGFNANLIWKSLSESADAIHKRLDRHDRWNLSGDDSLLPYAFHAAYSPLNLKSVFEPYYNAMSRALQPLLTKARKESEGFVQRFRVNDAAKIIDSSNSMPNPLLQRSSKLRLGLLSRNFYAHSNTMAFIGYLKYLNRDWFEVVVIHRHETTVDADHMYVNSLAEEVVYLYGSLTSDYATLASLGLDVLFFTDIGMDPFDFLIPNMRACPLQVTGWGLPHTTGLKSIDYYISSSWMEDELMQSEYSEKLVLLEGLPCCFPRDMLFFKRTDRAYFLLPDGELIIGCLQSLSKVHPDMDIIIEAVAKKLPKAIFAFMCSQDSKLDREFMDRISRRAPTAAERTLLINRCAAKDYLALCDCFDIILDTPYYGAGITSYTSTYVGTPTICFAGSRLRDRTTALIYQYIGIKNPPVARTISEYIQLVLTLASDSAMRSSLKKEIIDSAHVLYDDTVFIRSFEKFCLKIAESDFLSRDV